jgi:hypothetical protein
MPLHFVRFDAIKSCEMMPFCFVRYDAITFGKYFAIKFCEI